MLRRACISLVLFLLLPLLWPAFGFAEELRTTTLSELRGRLVYDCGLTSDFLKFAHEEFRDLKNSGITSFNIQGTNYVVDPAKLESALTPTSVAATGAPLYAGVEGQVQAMNWPHQKIVLSFDWENLRFQYVDKYFVSEVESQKQAAADLTARQLMWHEVLRWAGIADDYELHFALSQRLVQVTSEERKKEATLQESGSNPSQVRQIRVAIRLARFYNEKSRGFLGHLRQQQPASDADCKAMTVYRSDVGDLDPVLVHLDQAYLQNIVSARRLLDQYCDLLGNPTSCQSAAISLAPYFAKDDPDDANYGLYSSCWIVATVRFADTCTVNGNSTNVVPNYSQSDNESLIRLGWLNPTGRLRAQSWCLENN